MEDKIKFAGRDLNEEEAVKMTTDYIYSASKTRGVLINHIIFLERLMDRYISEYFCSTKEKAAELLDLILCTRRITFESKSEVLRVALDKNFPQKEKENTETRKEFQYIAEERNKLAHYLLDSSPLAVQIYLHKIPTFTLIKIDKVRTPEIFDPIRTRKLGDILVKNTNYLRELLGEKSPPPLTSLPDAPNKDI